MFLPGAFHMRRTGALAFVEHHFKSPCQRRLVLYHRVFELVINLSPANPSTIKGVTNTSGIAVYHPSSSVFS